MLLAKAGGKDKNAVEGAAFSGAFMGLAAWG